jgi:hypothetical protein
MQEMQPYAGDQGQSTGQGREVLATLIIKPFDRSHWTVVPAGAATNVWAVPKDARNIWRSQGTWPFTERCISAGGSEEFVCCPRSA